MKKQNTVRFVLQQTVVKLGTGKPSFNCGKEWKIAHDCFVLGIHPQSFFSQEVSSFLIFTTKNHNF